MNSSDLELLGQREQDKQRAFRCRLLCCASTPCLSSGGTSVRAVFEDAIKNQGLDAEVQVVATGCMGPCSRGPMVIVQEQDRPDVTYQNVTPAVAAQIVEEHVVAGQAVESHALPLETPFLTKQQKIVLSNSGLID